MSKFISFTTIASVFLLTACGGGGGGIKNDEDKVPATYNLNLNAVIQNSCGVETPYSKVKVFLQDQNWAVISEHQANAEGLVTLTSSTDKVNYTVLAEYKGANNIDSYQLMSYYQVDANASAKYYATNSDALDESSCECVTQDVLLSHVPIADYTNVISSANFSEFEVSEDGTETTFKEVESCRAKGNEWTEHSFAIYNEEQGYAGFFQEFDNTDSGIWEVYITGEGYAVSISRKDYAFTAGQIFDGQRHFSKDIEELARTAMVFDNHATTGRTTYTAKANYIFKEESSPFGSVTLKSQENRYSDDYNDSLKVAPSKDDENIDYITWSEIEADGSYDYSKVSRHQMAIVSYIYDSKDPNTQLDMPVLWSAYGPIEGQLPMNTLLPGFENIINDDVKIDKTEVKLLKHIEFSDYQDYINYYANIGHISVDEQLDKTQAGVHQYIIGLEK